MAIGRRQLLIGGASSAALAVVGGAGGYGLVEDGVLPGKLRLDRMLGACGTRPPIPKVTPGAVVSGSFRSAARRGDEVGWSVAYPPGADPHAPLDVCVALHGRGGDHRFPFDFLPVQYVLADAVDRGATRPFAIAAVDGGSATNWHRRADGDDPEAMVTQELLPLLERRGLRTDRIGLWGWSLGGYGALLLASRLGPSRVAAVAASSPAIWRRYADVEAGTFDDAADFARNDLFGRIGALDAVPLRIDCGTDDPFASAVRTFRRRLTVAPAGGLTSGCHDGAFWSRAAPAELAFLGAHLT